MKAIPFHDLRHTAATLLLQGVNAKSVRERLGHASIGITLDIYSHVLPDMQAQAAVEMDAALGACTPTRAQLASIALHATKRLRLSRLKPLQFRVCAGSR